MNLLEIIALTAEDAVRAEAGGADRLEVVGTMDDDGLSPSPELIAEIKAACTLPVRAMLRCRAGFALSEDADSLRQLGRALLGAGADGLVLGFLTRKGTVDTDALDALGVDGSFAWTFHRAIDYSSDPVEAWAQLSGWPGLDQVLTAGSPSGVAHGLGVLGEVTANVSYRQQILVGGGLAAPYVAPLRALGISGFHLGSAVRQERSFAQPIDVAAVADWRQRVAAPEVAGNL